MSENTEENAEKIDLSKMTDYEKLSFLKDKFLPVFFDKYKEALDNRRRQQLETCYKQARQPKIPKEFSHQSRALIWIAVRSIQDIFRNSSIGWRDDKVEHVNSFLANAIQNSSVRSFYFGYEDAKKLDFSLAHFIGSFSEYMETAIEPSMHYLSEIVNQFFLAEDKQDRELITDELKSTLLKNSEEILLNCVTEHTKLGAMYYFQKKR